MDPWESGDEDWWKGGNPFISFEVGKQYKFFSGPRILECLQVREMRGLTPMLDPSYKHFKKKFYRFTFLGVSSECDWLPDEMTTEDEYGNKSTIKEVDFGVFAGMSKGEKEFYIFFTQRAKDDDGHPLFEDGFS